MQGAAGLAILSAFRLRFRVEGEMSLQTMPHMRMSTGSCPLTTSPLTSVMASFCSSPLSQTNVVRPSAAWRIRNFIFSGSFSALKAKRYLKGASLSHIMEWNTLRTMDSVPIPAHMLPRTKFILGNLAAKVLDSSLVNASATTHLM